MASCFVANLCQKLLCSFPFLSCEFASVDVSDVLGTVSSNHLNEISFFSRDIFMSIVLILSAEQVKHNKNNSQVFNQSAF